MKFLPPPRLGHSSPLVSVAWHQLAQVLPPSMGAALSLGLIFPRMSPVGKGLLRRCPLETRHRVLWGLAQSFPGNSACRSVCCRVLAFLSRCFSPDDTGREPGVQTGRISSRFAAEIRGCCVRQLPTSLLACLGPDAVGCCRARHLLWPLSPLDAAAILQEEQTKKPCRKFLQTGEFF